MGLTLAGASVWLSSCDTAKTPVTDASDSLVLSHRSKFKEECFPESLVSEEKLFPKITCWRPTDYESESTQVASFRGPGSRRKGEIKQNLNLGFCTPFPENNS